MDGHRVDVGPFRPEAFPTEEALQELTRITRAVHETVSRRFYEGVLIPVSLSLSLSTIRGIHRIYRAGKKTNFHNCVTNSRRRIAGVLRYSTELLRMAQSGEREIRRVRNLRCYRTSMREMRHHFHQDFAIQLLSVEEKQRETVALIGR